MREITFLGTTLLFILLFYWATGQRRKSLLINGTWAIVISILSLGGIFSANPKLFLAALIGTILVNIALYREERGTHFRVAPLLIIQSLRIIVELYLYSLYLDKLLPKIMTFRGSNFDIFIGVAALLFLLLYTLRKVILQTPVFVIWNYLGILSLVAVVVTGILSSPVPLQQFGFEQPNTAVLVFPYALLPTIIVPVAIHSHLLLLRASRP